MELVQAIARWLHIIAGVMWIGLLYFFNFINAHFAATLDGDSKKKVVPELSQGLFTGLGGERLGPGLQVLF